MVLCVALIPKIFSKGFAKSSTRLRNFPTVLENYIASLEIYIARHEIYIARHEIYIARREIFFSMLLAKNKRPAEMFARLGMEVGVHIFSFYVQVFSAFIA